MPTTPGLQTGENAPNEWRERPQLKTGTRSAGEAGDAGEARWLRYANTLLTFDTAASIDLRTPVHESDHRLLRQLGLDRPFAVITAHNPRGATIDARTNEARHASLTEDLASAGQHFVEVVGRSPDGGHQERSVAVTMTEPEAKALAERLEQDAYFWFDGHTFSIRGAVRRVAPIRLPLTDVNGIG